MFVYLIIGDSKKENEFSFILLVRVIGLMSPEFYVGKQVPFISPIHHIKLLFMGCIVYDQKK